MFDRGLNMRLDRNSDEILDQLLVDLNSPSKAEIVRRSLRLMNKLLQVEKDKGEIIVRFKDQKDTRLILA